MTPRRPGHQHSGPTPQPTRPVDPLDPPGPVDPLDPPGPVDPPDPPQQPPAPTEARELRTPVPGSETEFRAVEAPVLESEWKARVIETPVPALGAEVREIEVPHALEELAALTPTDYRESLTLTLTVTRAATAEQWARMVLEGAPLASRAQMITLWTLLGIRLAPPWSASQVLGWRILHNAPDVIVLGARAAAGLTARVVFHTTDSSLTQAMLVRFDRPIGRRIWTRLAPGHRRFLKLLLTRAADNVLR